MQDVEDLAPHLVLRPLVCRDQRVGDVPDVDERAPHPAAAVQQQLPVQQRVLDERVDDEVEAHARGVAVDGAVAQEHRAQPVVSELEQALLAVALGGGVRRARLDRRGLVVHAGSHAVVERARGREHVALDPAVDAHAAQRLGGDRVHLPVGLGIELRRRIVREPRQVDDAVDPVEGLWRDVAHVGDHQVDPIAEARQRLVAEVEAIQEPHLVAAVQQPWHEHAADVAGAAGHEDRLPGAWSLRGQAIAARTGLGLFGLVHRGPNVAGESERRAEPNSATSAIASRTSAG